MGMRTMERREGRGIDNSLERGRGVDNGLDRGRGLDNGLDRGRVEVVVDDRATRTHADNRNDHCNHETTYQTYY